MKLEHYSPHSGLSTIDPSFHGKGVKGEESKRKLEPNWVNRSYHYVAGTAPEAMVGAHPHKYTSEVPDEKIYDYQRDPANLKQKSMWGQSLDRNLYEKNIKDAGYHGYINRGMQDGTMSNVVALFHPVKPQSVEHTGLAKSGGYTFHHSDMSDSDEEVGHHLVTVRHNGKDVGHFRYFKQKEFGSSKPHLYGGMIEVSPKHRRKGLASAMHTEAQKRHNLPFIRSQKETPSGKKLQDKIYGTSRSIPEPESLDKAYVHEHNIRAAQNVGPHFHGELVGVKNIDGHKIHHYQDEEYNYFVKHEGDNPKNKPIGSVTVVEAQDVGDYSEGKDWDGTPRVEHSSVLPQHQGKGLGTSIYKAALQHYGKLDSSQALSPASDATWKKLKKQPGIKVKLSKPDTDTAHRAEVSKLKKGSAQRRMPFNPDKVPLEQKETLHAWTTYGHGDYTPEEFIEDPQQAREQLPEMGPAERMRAISRLIRKTKVRRNPKTGEHEVLLHRGVSKDEKESGKGKGYFDTRGTKTSWTHKKDVAKKFAQPSYSKPPGELDEYQDEYSEPAFGGKGGTISAWIPLKDIHNIPNQYGNVQSSLHARGKSDYRDEHEVVVKPGKFKLATNKPTKIKPALKSEDTMAEDMKKAKNVKEEKKRIFGTDPNAPRTSERRMKMMQIIRDYAKKHYGLDMTTAAGKREASGKLREDKGMEKQSYDVFSKKGVQKEKELQAKIDAENVKREKKGEKPIKRVDPKPDWQSGKLETQPSPDAAVHEIAHLIHEKEGQNLPEMQRRMDQSWGESQKKYGHMQQKKTEGEIQPQAMENPLRRRMGLPANRSYKNPRPMEEHGRPVEQAIDETGPRFIRGVKPGKNPQSVDYDRQSRLLSPEHREKFDKVGRGELTFDKEKGWVPGTSANAKINIRAREKAKDPTRKDVKTLMRSDEPHAPETPEDKAHDVVEEGQSLQSAMGEVGHSGIGKLLQHLRSLKHDGLRSPENEAAGADVNGVMGKSKKWPVPGMVPPSGDKSELKKAKFKQKTAKTPESWQSGIDPSHFGQLSQSQANPTTWMVKAHDGPHKGEWFYFHQEGDKFGANHADMDKPRLHRDVFEKVVAPQLASKGVKGEYDGITNPGLYVQNGKPNPRIKNNPYMEGKEQPKGEVVPIKKADGAPVPPVAPKPAGVLASAGSQANVSKFNAGMNQPTPTLSQMGSQIAGMFKSDVAKRAGASLQKMSGMLNNLKKAANPIGTPNVDPGQQMVAYKQKSWKMGDKILHNDADHPAHKNFDMRDHQKAAIFHGKMAEQMANEGKQDFADHHKVQQIKHRNAWKAAAPHYEGPSLLKSLKDEVGASSKPKAGLNTGEKTKVETMAKKQGVPKGANPATHERCVQDVKKQGHSKSSAYAICNAAGAGMKKGEGSQPGKKSEPMAKAQFSKTGDPEERKAARKEEQDKKKAMKAIGEKLREDTKDYLKNQKGTQLASENPGSADRAKSSLRGVKDLKNGEQINKPKVK